MTEFESERERVAAMFDFRLVILDGVEEGKTEYTSDEVLALIDNFVRSIKQHK